MCPAGFFFFVVGVICCTALNPRQGDYSSSFELFDVAMLEFTELFQSNHYSVSDMVSVCTAASNGYF
jgi:hypothetical protein